MATLALSVPLAPPSPLVPSRRDLVVTQGDDVTLQFTIYDTDASTTPKNVTGATLRVRVFPAGCGPSELEVSGTIVDAATGRMNAALTDLLADISGEYRWQAQFTLSSVSTTICEGAMIVRAEAAAA